MGIKSQLHDIKVQPLLSPVIVAATTTTLALDTKGFESSTIVLNVGDFAFTDANSLTVSVQESDDNVTYGAVPSRKIVGAVPVLHTAAHKEVVHSFGVVDGKRYLKVKMTEKGNVSVVISVFGLLSLPHEKPVS